MCKIYDMYSKFMRSLMFSRNSFKSHSKPGFPWDSSRVKWTSKKTMTWPHSKIWYYTEWASFDLVWTPKFIIWHIISVSLNKLIWIVSDLDFTILKNQGKTSVWAPWLNFSRSYAQPPASQCYLNLSKVIPKNKAMIFVFRFLKVKLTSENKWPIKICYLN